MIQTEVPLLSALSPLLPLAVPCFEYVVSKPTGNYLPFAGYKMLPGEPLTDLPAEIMFDNWWREPVANFLYMLHSFSILKSESFEIAPFSFLPTSQTNSDWRSSLEDFYTATRNRIYPLLTIEDQDKIADQFEEFLDNDQFFKFQTTLIHGDFSEEHVLLDLAKNQVTGIIDFGDVALGDPAYDLWESLLPYYPIPAHDETFAERCHFYKKLLPLHSLLFGQETADSALIEYGLYELRRLWLKDR